MDDRKYEINEGVGVDANGGTPARPEKFDVAGIIGKRGREFTATPGKYRDPMGHEKAYVTDADAALTDFARSITLAPGEAPINATLDQIIQGTGFQRNYPEVAAQTRVVIRPMQGNVGASFDQRSGIVSINANQPKARWLEHLLHELEHARARTEGHSTGSNPGYAAMSTGATLYKRAVEGDSEAARLIEQVVGPKWTTMDYVSEIARPLGAFLYRRNLNEAEGRVSPRMKGLPSGSNPEAHFDVPEVITPEGQRIPLKPTTPVRFRRTNEQRGEADISNGLASTTLDPDVTKLSRAEVRYLLSQNPDDDDLREQIDALYAAGRVT